MERIERSGRGECSDAVIAASSGDSSAVVLSFIEMLLRRTVEVSCAKYSGGIPLFKRLGGP